MTRRFYTIYVVPHARARFRQLRVSLPFALSLATLGGGLLIGGLLLPGLLWSSWTRGSVNAQLRQENGDLRQANESYEEDVADLRSQVADFEALATKFALLAGVEDLPSSGLPFGSGGDLGGGPPPGAGLRPSYLDEELSILKGRAGALDESFHVLEEAFAAQEVRLAGTPSILPTKGLIGSGFHNRKDPFTGKQVFHGGLDIVANAGTSVVATADGVVQRAGRQGSYGKAVFLSHGNGFTTRYAHLSSVEVKAGQKVRRGDVIGKVGATGRAMGYHLHYEILRDDRRVNPMEFIVDQSTLR